MRTKLLESLRLQPVSMLTEAKFKQKHGLRVTTNVSGDYCYLYYPKGDFTGQVNWLRRSPSTSTKGGCRSRRHMAQGPCLQWSLRIDHALHGTCMPCSCRGRGIQLDYDPPKIGDRMSTNQEDAVVLKWHFVRGIQNIKGRWQGHHGLNVLRAQVPGGWLVAGIVDGGDPSCGSVAPTFVPDPTHEWDGRSLDYDPKDDPTDKE